MSDDDLIIKVEPKPAINYNDKYYGIDSDPAEDFEKCYVDHVTLGEGSAGLETANRHIDIKSVVRENKNTMKKLSERI